MSSATPDVSVVVPVYNVEAYLRECVDSILAQTHRSIEVILVNDGSKDDSLAIMRDYEARDARVKVIDKPNGGYGHSVNRGIEAATGTWLSIIEPDDIIDVRMYADLLANARLEDGTLADVVKSSYWLYYDLEDGSEPYTEAPNLMTYMPHERQVLDAHGLRELLFHHPSIWSAIYRRDFIEAEGIRMIEPKGAGWADNPWFFDTILRAKSVVWWPQAYYLYRQTNPNASSKSPAKELPFDRLRDLRRIVQELGVESRSEVMIPLYNRSFCYILDSVLDEYGYPESDPELQGLIREVLESMDRATVLEASFGIPESQKSYYRDVMGIYLEELMPVSRPASPRLSIVLAMDNDRQELWPTVLSLTSQQFRSFEVLCVDTGSHNRFAQIVEDISKVDARFSLIRLGEEATASEAFEAGLAAARGDYVQFWRPGVVYPYRTDLGHIFEHVDLDDDFVADEALGPVSARPGVPEAIVTTERPLANVVPAGLSVRPESKAATLDPSGIRAALVGSGRAGAYGMAFSRSFLEGAQLRFDATDSEALAFAVSALDAARLVTLVRGGSPDAFRAMDLANARLRESEDLRSAVGEGIALLSDAAGKLGEPQAGHALLLDQFARVLGLVLTPEGGRELFETASALFAQCFEDADLAGLTIVQFEEYQRLRRVFAAGYTGMLEQALAAGTSHGTDAQGEVLQLQRNVARLEMHLRSIRESFSFRVGRALTAPVRAASTRSPLRLLTRVRGRI